MDDSLFRSLENKPVYLKVFDNKFIIEESNVDLVNNYWNKKEKKSNPIKLIVSTKLKSVLPINKISNRSVSNVGSKAANFGHLSSLKDELNLNIKIPENAFVIPFYYYEKHIESNDIKKLINELSIHKEEYLEQGILQKYLENIRSLIINSKIDSLLIKK